MHSSERYLARDSFVLQQKEVLLLLSAGGLPFSLCPPLSALFLSLKKHLLNCLQKRVQDIHTTTGSEEEKGEKRQKGEARIDGFLYNFSPFIGDTVIQPSLSSNRISPCSKSAQEGETGSCTREKIKPNSYPSSSLAQ